MAKRIAAAEAGQPDDYRQKIFEALMRLVSEVPASDESKAVSPEKRARALTLQASATAAVLSGTLALPPGPLGMVTILPDLMAIWKIQRKLVSDIAACYGKSSDLGQAQMIYCLFKHASSQAVRDLVVRVGERFLVRRATLRVVQRALRRVGVSITQRVAGRAVSRYLPVVGAVGIAAYAFYDTSHVGQNAIELFGRAIGYEEGAGPEQGDT